MYIIEFSEGWYFPNIENYSSGNPINCTFDINNAKTFNTYEEVIQFCINNLL